MLPQVLNDMLVYCLQQRIMAASELFPTHRAEQQRVLQRMGRLSADAMQVLSQLRHSVCSVPALHWASQPAPAGVGVPNIELLSHLLFPQTRWAPVPAELLGLLSPLHLILKTASKQYIEFSCSSVMSVTCIAI